MAIYNTSELNSLELIHNDGSFNKGSVNSLLDLSLLELVYNDGSFSSNPAGGGVEPPAFDTTRMFLIF